VQGLEAVFDAAARQAHAVLLPVGPVDMPGTMMAPLDALVTVVPADLRAARPVLDTLRLTRFLHPQAVCLALVADGRTVPTFLLGLLSECGVEGVLTCRSTPETLVQTLLQVLRGERVMVPALPGFPWRPADFAGGHRPLTDGQRHLLMLLLSGMSYPEAARHLGISTKTLSGYKCALLAQMKLTLPALIAAGHRLGQRRRVLAGARLTLRP
jgi:DNA-binding NarL/FixJ family response regulator